MNVDTTQIESLLAQKKYDEVQSLIREATSTALSEQEKGAVLSGLALSYMEISNAIQARYREALQEAIMGMKEINAAETKSSEAIRLAEVRSELNG